MMMNPRRSFCSLVLFLGFVFVCGGMVSCEEEEMGDEEGLADPSLSDTDNRDSETFEKTDLSPFIETSLDKKFVRLAFSFFPDGTDVDFSNKTVKIPCTFLARLPEGLDIDLSAPLAAPCQEPYTVAFPESDSRFTLNGIVVPVGAIDQKFSENFGFRITVDGIFDAFDGVLLDSEKGKLEHFYQLVLDKRTPPT